MDGSVDVTPATAMTAIFEAYDQDQIFFTPTSIKESTYSGLVKKSLASPSTFRLLDPLTPELWATIALSVAVCATLIVLLDVIRPSSDGSRPSVRTRVPT